MELRTPEKRLAPEGQEFFLQPSELQSYRPQPEAEDDWLRDYRDGLSCHFAYNQRLVPAISSSVTPAFAIMSCIFNHLIKVVERSSLLLSLVSLSLFRRTLPLGFDLIGLSSRFVLGEGQLEV